ncbi:hypothetical protein ABH920_007884 [Catenulispora sp. EB89]|uniref:hypothetical protein n=1 Tax=Catenulispora sp. EB89 TaxID=3156257 RepID=UPI003518931C
MPGDGITEAESLIQQIVYEHRPGKGVVPVRYTMPDEELDILVGALYLGSHVAASPDLPNGGNLFYRRFGTDHQWAMLAYRETAPLQRLTSRAHILIAPCNVLTPDAAVAMWDWPWLGEAEGGKLPELTDTEFRGRVEETKRSWQVTSTPAMRRLIVELVCHDQNLVVKARPELRRDLLIEVANQAPASLRKGFSVHETRYDESQKSLPRLCFISEEQAKTGYEIRRRLIDLDVPEPDQSPMSEIASVLADYYRRDGSDGVAAVLDHRIEGHQETIRGHLTRWGVPTHSPVVPQVGPPDRRVDPVADREEDRHEDLDLNLDPDPDPDSDSDLGPDQDQDQDLSSGLGPDQDLDSGSGSDSDLGPNQDLDSGSADPATGHRSPDPAEEDQKQPTPAGDNKEPSGMATAAPPALGPTSPAPTVPPVGADRSYQRSSSDQQHSSSGPITSAVGTTRPPESPVVHVPTVEPPEARRKPMPPLTAPSVDEQSGPDRGLTLVIYAYVMAFAMVLAALTLILGSPR